MANYFQGAKDFTINGGIFGQDHSRHTTYHGPVHRTNDYSTHTTNYGGYVNYGQHASGGAINNHGPQTTNNGPIYDYQQYAGSTRGNRRSSRPPSAPEEFDAPPRNPIRPGQQNRRYPPQAPPFDTNSTYGRNDDDDDDDGDLTSDEDAPSLPPPRRAQRPTVPTRRPQSERPANHDDSFIDELRTLSPEMRRYIRTMQQRNRGPIPPLEPESELQDRMADMQLDDPEASRPPAGRNSPRAPGPKNPPRRGLKTSARARGPPPAHVGDSSSEDESDSDGDAPLHGRANITSTDSNNVNSTTVVDSHNDNSTRTEISKEYGNR